MPTQLIKLKLLNYQKNVFKSLYDYSTGFLLWGSLLVFGAVNLSTIAKPIQLLLQDSSSAKQTSLYLVLVYSLFIGWFICQKNLLFNSDFESYLQTLPISSQQHRRCNLVMIFIANHFLWLLLIIGIKLAWPSSNSLQLLLKTLFLITALMTIQLSIHYRQIYKIMGLGFINLIFVLTNNTQAPAAIMLYPTLIVCCLWLCFTQSGLLNSANRPYFNLAKVRINSPLISMQLAMLTHHKSRLAVKVFSACLLQLILFTLINQRKNPDIIYAITPIQLVSIAIMTCFATALARQTQTMKDYFASLPLSPYYWLIKNICLSSVITLLVILPGLFTASVLSMFPVMQLIYFCISIPLINALVYFMALKSFKNSNLLLFMAIAIVYTGQLAMVK